MPQQWTNSASLVFLTPAISGENHLVPLWSTLVLPSNYITHSIEIDLTTSFDYRTTNFDDTSHISLKWNFHPRVRKKIWKINIISGLINYIDFSPFFYFFPIILRWKLHFKPTGDVSSNNWLYISQQTSLSQSQRNVWWSWMEGLTWTELFRYRV